MVKYCYSNHELRNILSQNIDKIILSFSSNYAIHEQQELYAAIKDFHNLNSLAKKIHVFCQKNNKYKPLDVYAGIFSNACFEKNILNIEKTREYRELKANLPEYHTNEELYKYISNISDKNIIAMIAHFDIDKKYGMKKEELAGILNYLTDISGSDVLRAFKSNISLIEDYLYNYHIEDENIEISTHDIFSYFLTQLGFGKAYITYHYRRL